MPVIGIWIDGAMHVVAGEGTRKGRGLAADDRCVIATTSTTLPSLDIVIEGHAERLTDDATVRHVTEFLVGAQLAARGRGHEVYGPHGLDRRPATAYAIYRIVPTRVFGLPGMVGMDQPRSRRSAKADALGLRRAALRTMIAGGRLSSRGRPGTRSRRRPCP